MTEIRAPFPTSYMLVGIFVLELDNERSRKCQRIGLPRIGSALERCNAWNQAFRGAEIAIDSGFYDQSHFNRVFKQTFGLPPGRYRKVNSVQ